jgi:hypothetical protein
MLEVPSDWICKAEYFIENHPDMKLSKKKNASWRRRIE